MYEERLYMFDIFSKGKQKENEGSVPSEFATLVDVVEIPIERISRDEHQPRTVFEEEKLDELAASIRENGLLQPITVRRVEDNQFQIIAGERRFRAMKKLNYEVVPAIIYDRGDHDVRVLSLIENVQRENLSVIEEAKAYVYILEAEKITQQELAKRVGKSQSAIANKLRLLALPKYILEALERKELTERHGRALLTAPQEHMQQLFEDIQTYDYTVKELEEAILRVQEPPKKKMAVSFRVNDARIAYSTFRTQVKKAEKAVQKTGIAYEILEEESDEYVELRIRIKR